MKKLEFSDEAKAAREWFLNSVTFEDEPYIMDLEQAEAVVDNSQNALVIARAGSGKTRTLVAKIIYLVAKRGVDPNDILAFVFNANAAAEINERLSQMLVNGHPVIEKSKIASTFHAFSRRIVYDIAGGRNFCGDILAGEKDDFIFELVRELQKNPAWAEKIRLFIRGDDQKTSEKQLKKRQKFLQKFRRQKHDLADAPVSLLGDASDFNLEPEKNNTSSQDSLSGTDSKKPITTQELRRFASSMSQFVNRAQQRFLGSGTSLPKHLEAYRSSHQLTPREELFLELGAECHRRYHWRLLDENAHLPAFRGFRTDFNLIVSWASQIIASHRPETDALLESKKYILIDEYQDFSQLFLSAVKSIREVAEDARLFAVGDDWQAINRFAGSDVDYFKNFQNYFPDKTRLLNISTNYRCHYQIVDTARTFMNKAMREKGNFEAFSKKSGEIFLVDPSKTPLGFALVDYDDRVSPTDKLYKKFVQSLLKDPPKKATVQYIKTLVEIIKENPTAKEILFLHRNNDTNLQNLNLDLLQKRFPVLLHQLGITNAKKSRKSRKSSQSDPKKPSKSSNPTEQSIRFMTMHKSKGLESDVVVLLEADDGVIPRVHPDTYLYRFFGETEEVVLDDQKRLFYVALTRAKKRLYIIHRPAPKKSEDGFIQYLDHNLIKWHDDD